MSSTCWFIAALVLRLQATVFCISLGGSFDTRTDVRNEANLALDIAEMRQADTINERMSIYRDGKNSQQLNDHNTLDTVSLSSLSLDSASIMSEDPTYNYYRTAFRVIGSDYEDEDFGNFDDSPAEQYANTIVEDLFDVNSEDKIETEAALVMNVWMTVAHFLHKTVRTCTPNAGSTVKNTALEALDKAAAYWIGAGQEQGDNDTGNMLYNLAEKAGEHFGQDDFVTRVNRNIISLMKKMQTDIDDGLCGTTEDGYQVIRKTVNDIISQMTVPFVQNFLHYLKENDDEFIELYTLALLPQINSCSPASFSYFLKTVVIRVFSDDKFDEVLNELRAMYSCFGITCEDVGAYRTDEIPACSDVKPTGNDDDLFPAIAGYTPRTDVSNALMIDRDVRQALILTENQAYNAALDLYRYGRNAKNTIEDDDTPYLTLRGLATGSQRTALQHSSYWAAYQEYYETHQYPDTMITDALLARNPFDDPASHQQRYEVVFRTLQGMVSYQAGVQEIVAALELCTGEDIENDAQASKAPLVALDRGLAFLVGSLEGHERHGSKSNDGVLLYALAEELCADFDGCARSADANEDFVNLLFRGQVAIVHGDCEAYEELLDDILLEKLVAPLVMGTLHYSVMNERLQVGSTEGSLGALHALSRTILPLVASAADVGGNLSGAEYAEILDRNTVFTLVLKPVRDGADAVFGAVSQTVNSFSDCRDIGVYLSKSTSDELTCLHSQFCGCPEPEGSGDKEGSEYSEGSEDSKTCALCPDGEEATKLNETSVATGLNCRFFDVGAKLVDESLGGDCHKYQATAGYYCGCRNYDPDNRKEKDLCRICGKTLPPDPYRTVTYKDRDFADFENILTCGAIEILANNFASLRSALESAGGMDDMEAFRDCGSVQSEFADACCSLSNNAFGTSDDPEPAEEGRDEPTIAHKPRPPPDTSDTDELGSGGSGNPAIIILLVGTFLCAAVFGAHRWRKFRYRRIDMPNDMELSSDDRDPPMMVEMT